MQPNGNTAPAVWGYDIVDKLADHTAVTMFDVDAAREEIVKLREAIRRLAEQDATLSVRNGAVTVTMDATLTDAERAAVEFFSVICFGSPERRRHADTLRALLARLGGGK
jgi:plasmid stabilization system protein ParE